MSNFNTNKINGSTLEADEWNQLQDLENLVSTSGINPDTSLLNQIPQAVSNYVAIASFYTDNGIANAYNLTPINNFKSPTQYITGMLVRFRTANPNTGASTVNVVSLGVKNIKKADGTTDLIAGDIATGTDIELRYDGTNFLLNSVVLASATATTQGTQYLNKPITISNNIADADNDIDFSAGNFIFSDGSGSTIASAMTKRLDDNWTAGNNGGGLDTGTKANNTWYHCYAIYNPTTQASDFLFSASATSPTLPTGFTKFYLIESIKTNFSGNIIAFYQKITQGGDIYTFLKDKPLDISFISAPTTKTNYAITSPLGRSVIQIVRATLHWGGDTIDRSLNILSPFDNSLTPIVSSADLVSDNNYISSIEKQVVTNTNGEISIICSHSTVTFFNLISIGWIK